jgi:hypothetical protein
MSRRSPGAQPDLGSGSGTRVGPVENTAGWDLPCIAPIAIGGSPMFSKIQVDRAGGVLRADPAEAQALSRREDEVRIRTWEIQRRAQV